MAGIFIKRKLGHRYTQRDDRVKTQGKLAIYKPETEASEKTQPCQYLEPGLLVSRIIRK